MKQGGNMIRLLVQFAVADNDIPLFATFFVRRICRQYKGRFVLFPFHQGIKNKPGIKGGKNMLLPGKYNSLVRRGCGKSGGDLGKREIPAMRQGEHELLHLQKHGFRIEVGKKSTVIDEHQAKRMFGKAHDGQGVTGFFKAFLNGHLKGKFPVALAGNILKYGHGIDKTAVGAGGAEFTQCGD